MELLIKPEKAKENYADNHTYKILRLLDILSDFSFTASERKNDY